MDHMELKRKIETFSLDDGDLGNQGYERVLLQLFGYTGHGKSSFINSCKYVLHGGELSEFAKAGERSGGGSMTLIRRSYKLTPKITIVDNRGSTSMKGFEQAEVYAQLGNFCPLNQPVEWKDNFNDLMSILEENGLHPNDSDFLVPIFIFSAKTMLSDKENEDVKKFLTNCVQMTGVFPIIVITNKTSGNYLDVEEMFRLMGAEVIIPIENFTKQNHEKTPGRTTDILMVLDNALKNVEYRLQQSRNPMRGRIERKKFLLNFIHEADELRRKEKKQPRDPWTLRIERNEFLFNFLHEAAMLQKNAREARERKDEEERKRKEEEADEARKKKEKEESVSLLGPLGEMRHPRGPLYGYWGHRGSPHLPQVVTDLQMVGDTPAMGYPGLVTGSARSRRAEQWRRQWSASAHARTGVS